MPRPSRRSDAMFTYYLDLAVRSLKRNVALTILMIVAIAFGVGASMTTLTVMHVLSQDPIPAKSDRLFYVQLDPRKMEDFKPGDEPSFQMTRLDAQNLIAAHKGKRQVMMTGGSAPIYPDRPDLPPFFIEARWASADFFAMFDTPFLAGGGWSADDDAKNARVAVIARALAVKV